MRFRLRRALTLGAGIVVAAVSFVLLTSSAQTSSLHVQGTLRSTFRPAYDILVRPPDSQTPLETSERLVRPNFLSGIFGGIKLSQWRQIEQIRGVAVAAPVANIGYLLVDTSSIVSLNRFLTREPFQLYRVRFSYIGAAGTSRYPGATSYVYYTRRDRFTWSPLEGTSQILPSGRALTICAPDFLNGVPGLRGKPPFQYYASPFNAHQTTLDCYSARAPTQGSARGGFYLPGQVATGWKIFLPVLVAAIDPVQEARLVHLDRAVVGGRYLRASEGAQIARTVAGFGRRLLPAVVSARTYVDESVVQTVERVQIPKEANTARRFHRPGGWKWVARLPGKVVARTTISAQALYEKRLGQRHPQQPSLDWLGSTYWTPSDVRYRRSSEGVTPQPIRPSWSIWLQSPTPGGSGTYWSAPMPNADVQFRRITPHQDSPLFTYARLGHERLQINRTPQMVAVGTFDPGKLPGFSPLSKVPLETYYPPELNPADAKSRTVLRGQPLRPTENIGDYIQQPPLVLTTLEAASWFSDPQAYAGVKPAARAAPISVIRIRVEGVNGPDPVSLERIRVVAQKIHDATGLAVDITAGSSPHPLSIDLPAGKFGRPALLLREGWSKKGVTVSFLRALDRKDLALFALILAVCAFFLGNGALAAVQARRAEIGTLLTLGWSRFAIFAVVLGEILLVGLLAGVVGTGIAALLAVALGLHLSLLRALLVLPIAVGLALVAGSLPAWLAARGTPLDALRPPVIARRRARPVHRLASLALVNLARVPTRTLLGVAGLMVGVAALTVLLAIELAFQGTLVGTVLGNALSLQVRGTDFAAVGLTIALAGLSVSDVLYLNLRERAAELVTLRTLGWSERHTRTVVLLEGLALGLLGSLAGAFVGLGIGALVLGVPLAPLMLASLAAGAGGTAIAAVASLLPLSQLNRLSAPAVLAAE